MCAGVGCVYVIIETECIKNNIYRFFARFRGRKSWLNDEMFNLRTNSTNIIRVFTKVKRYSVVEWLFYHPVSFYLSISVC